MKKFLFLIILLFCLTEIDAKADNVIIKGDTLWTIFSSPFDSYPGIVKLRERLADYSTQCTEDNCSFLSTWKIVNNHLVLAKIENCKCNQKQQTANLKNLFGDRVKKGMMEAYWFSGEMWVTKDRPNSWKGLFAASWPRETRLVVKNGVVVSIKNFVYPKPVETVYYKNSDSLTRFIYTHLNWAKMHNLPQHNTAYYFRFEQDTSGYLTNLKYMGRSASDETFTGDEMAELNRVAGMIQWPVYYYHGKPVENFRGFDIVLSEDLKAKYAK